MRVLLDHCVPRRFRRHLPGHEVRTCYDMGWSAYKNGVLLAAAETGRFDVLLTVDRSIQNQQNMAGRKIAIVALRVLSNKIESLLPLVPRTLLALENAAPGSVTFVEFP